MRDVGFRLQINATVHASNVDDLPELLAWLVDQDVLWSAFLLVPTDRGATMRSLGADTRRSSSTGCTRSGDFLPIKLRRPPRPPLDVNAGRGVLFVDHVGGVPRAPELRRLRDVESYTGRGSCCEFCHVCGWSRSRAYAASGDPFGDDPACSFVPARSISVGP